MAVSWGGSGVFPGGGGGGGGSTTPGGSNTQVQFNDAGHFGGAGNIFFDSQRGELYSWEEGDIFYADGENGGFGSEFFLNPAEWSLIDNGVAHIPGSSVYPLVTIGYFEVVPDVQVGLLIRVTSMSAGAITVSVDGYYGPVFSFSITAAGDYSETFQTNANRSVAQGALRFSIAGSSDCDAEIAYFDVWGPKISTRIGSQIRYIPGAVTGAFAVSAGNDGSLAWQPAADLVFTSPGGGAAGNAGFVPAPATGDEGKFLRGDATWAPVPPPAGAWDGSYTALTEGVATDVAAIAFAASSAVSVEFLVTIVAIDDVEDDEIQALTSRVRVTGVRKSTGDAVCSVSIVGTDTAAVSSGTLTLNAATVTGTATGCTLLLDATSSLTEASLTASFSYQANGVVTVERLSGGG